MLVCLSIYLSSSFLLFASSMISSTTIFLLFVYMSASCLSVCLSVCLSSFCHKLECLKHDIFQQLLWIVDTSTLLLIFDSYLWWLSVRLSVCQSISCLMIVCLMSVCPLPLVCLSAVCLTTQYNITTQHNKTLTHKITLLDSGDKYTSSHVAGSLVD